MTDRLLGLLKIMNNNIEVQEHIITVQELENHSFFKPTNTKSSTKMVQTAILRTSCHCQT